MTSDELPGGAPSADPLTGSRRSLARRVVAFAGLPFLSLATPFLFLPLLARIAGADAWLAIAVGQSVGAFAALVIALGYNTVGPTMVARSAAPQRAEILRSSLAPRLALAAPAAAAATVVAVVVAPDPHRLEAALMALALAASGLSAAWFMVGLGRVRLIIGYELVPRMLATVAAAILLLTTGVVQWYPVLLLLVAVVAPIAFAARTLGRAALHPGSPRAVLDVMRRNASALAIEVAGGAYNSLAVTFVGAAATVPAASAYVSGDKLYRLGQYAASALGNATQGWVVEAGEDEFRRRARRALLLHLALGLIGFAAFAFLGVPLSALLFGQQVAIDEATALGFGAAAFGICVGTGLGRVTLVALGARREFLVCVLIGASVGVPAIIVLASMYGAAGGAWGLAFGELASVVAQAVFVRLRWPGRQAGPTGSRGSSA